MATRPNPEESQLATTGKALAVAGLAVFLFVSIPIGGALFLTGLVLALAGGAR